MAWHHRKAILLATADSQDRQYFHVGRFSTIAQNKRNFVQSTGIESGIKTIPKLESGILSRSVD